MRYSSTLRAARHLACVAMPELQARTRSIDETIPRALTSKASPDVVLDTSEQTFYHPRMSAEANERLKAEGEPLDCRA